MFPKKHDLTTLAGIRGQVLGWMRTKRPTISATGKEKHCVAPILLCRQRFQRGGSKPSKKKEKNGCKHS
jgi:hypothetical protein